MNNNDIKNKYFVQFNPNPKNLITNDCIIRAICACEDKQWDEVFDNLIGIAKELKRMPNSIEVLENYLDINNYQKFNIDKSLKDLDLLTFCIENSKGIFIVDLGNHIVSVKNGKFFDLGYSTSKYLVETYWEKIQ